MQEIFARYCKALEQTEFLPEARLARYQQGLQRRVARHAYEHVPFYRDRLGCLFVGGAEADLTRWHEVPIVTRAEAAAHAQEMRSPELPVTYGSIAETSTSGSTGVPLQIACNSLAAIAGNAALTRLARWWGADPAQSLADIRIHRKDPPQYPEGRAQKGWSVGHPDAVTYELDLTTPVVQQLEWLLRKKAPYWKTSASNTLALAYAATPEETRALGVKLIFAIAETVLPRTRDIVEEKLGAPIAAIYSCEEVGIMATQCPALTGYHIVAENAVVEILRDDGSAAAPGETGQVVVTGLYNYAMPFIRYAIGDVATAASGHCPCGRSLPMIAQIDGRTRHAFLFEDGTRVWPRLWQLELAPVV